MPEVTQTDENAWYLEDDDIAIGYMCGVDWQHHILCDSRGTRVFGSRECLEHNKGCTKECGIVEVEVKVRRWVVPQNLHGDE